MSTAPIDVAGVRLTVYGGIEHQVLCATCSYYMTLTKPASDVEQAVRRYLLARGHGAEGSVLEAECPNGHRVAIVTVGVGLLDRAAKNALLSSSGGGG